MSRSLRAAILAICCAATIAWGAAALAADEHPKKAEHPGATAEHPGEGMDMSAMMPKPGPMHALLQKSVGKWKSTNSMKMDPSAPPMVFEGSEEITSVCGGLYVMIASTAGGAMPFEGHGIEGYDEHSKKFVGSWVDNMGTAIYSFEGTANSDGTVRTYTMSGPNPMTGETMSQAMVSEITSPTTRTMKMWMGPKPEGEPIMVIKYTKM